MSSLEELKNKGDESNTSLNLKKSNLSSNDNIKEIEDKNSDNTLPKKSEIQFPSSTLDSNNSNLPKKDIIKLGQLIPDFINSTNENNKFNFFQSKKINNSESKDNINDISDKSCYCNCTKTRCIKKYCECYANNRYCKDCHCVNCMNKPDISGAEIQKDSIEEEAIFCTCSKSNCKKKYCDCFKSGIKCTDKCRCINCKNKIIPSFRVKYSNENSNNKNDNSIINNDINNIEEIKEKEEINEQKDSNDDYQIQRVSIYINKVQTIINVEKFTEEMMLINKKRKNIKN